MTTMPKIYPMIRSVTLYEYAAYVIRVVDGDTVDLGVDLGFRHRFTDRFRLYGINTPERGQAGWAEATTYLRQILVGVGEELAIRTHLDKRDKYGRWLAEIYKTQSDGTILYVNQDMIDKGHAVEYMT